MQSVLDKLTENMQLIYRRAIDADKALAQLQSSGQGKFAHIFNDDAGFEVQSKRFMPYVEELGKDIAALASADTQTLQSELPAIVKKLELLMKTLGNFQTSLKG